MSQKYYIYDNIVATLDQTIFEVSKPYVSGTLNVYRNGLLVSLGEHADYVEVDNNTIQFNYPIGEGLTDQDDITIISLQSLEDASTQIVANNLSNPHALFFKYGTKVKLLANNVFNVNIKVKKKTYNWHFTSKYNPYLTTSDKVRSDTGDLLNGVTDEQLDYLIYLNSKELVMTYKINNIVDPITATITPSVILQYKKSWVRYKSDLDLVNAAYLSISGIAGGVKKSIGEIQIDKTYTIPKLKEMMEYFNSKFQVYDQFVQNKLSSQAFVKAKTQAYPYLGRAGF